MHQQMSTANTKVHYPIFLPYDRCCRLLQSSYANPPFLSTHSCGVSTDSAMESVALESATSLFAPTSQQHFPAAPCEFSLMQDGNDVQTRSPISPCKTRASPFSVDTNQRFSLSLVGQDAEERVGSPSLLPMSSIVGHLTYLSPAPLGRWHWRSK